MTSVFLPQPRLSNCASSLKETSTWSGGIPIQPTPGTLWTQTLTSSPNKNATVTWVNACFLSFFLYFFTSWTQPKTLPLHRLLSAGGEEVAEPGRLHGGVGVSSGPGQGLSHTGDQDGQDYRADTHHPWATSWILLWQQPSCHRPQQRRVSVLLPPPLHLFLLIMFFVFSSYLHWPRRTSCLELLF